MMNRVVVLGRGGAGKSTLARRLGEVTQLPVIELDSVFWSRNLTGMDLAQWEARQEELVGAEAWILDGDLGPYDVPHVRLRAADTVIVLDFSFARCAWRAVRRGRERADFWRWVWAYRRRSLPLVMQQISAHAPRAELHVLRTPRAVRRLLTEVSRNGRTVEGVDDPEEIARRTRWFERYVDQLSSNSVSKPEQDGPYACPCCGYLTLAERGGFEICDVCFWEDDGQDVHDADVVRGGPNGALSLTRAQANFRAFGANRERDLPHVRAPHPHERPLDDGP